MTDPIEIDPRLNVLAAAVDASKGRSATPFERRAAVLKSGEIDQTAAAFNVFASLLQSDGIRTALYSVLRRSDYRFIGIFRFKDGKATSAVHVDRENLGVTQAGEVDDTATYCSYARASGSPFVTADARADERTVGHVARDSVLSYCGIPIFEPGGEFIGTLCHYDLVPRDPDQLDLDLLIQVSSALEQSGLIPAYPDPQPG
jgi:GAF domain-containing protein